MKKIKSFYYEIVIANIYLLDINKREYDESSVYDGIWVTLYNPQIEMFARFKMKSSFHKTKRII